MQYRRLGQSALKLSALSYGSWITFGTTLDDRAARDCLACAYDHGINFFDSAEVYLGGEAERMPRHQGAGLAARRLLRVEQGAVRRRRQSCARRPRPTQQGRAASTWSRLRAGAAALRAGLSGPVPVPSTGPGHVDPGNRLDHAPLVQQGKIHWGTGMAGGRHRDAVRLADATTWCRRSWSSRSTACSIASASSTSTIRWSSGAGWG